MNTKTTITKPDLATYKVLCMKSHGWQLMAEVVGFDNALAYLPKMRDEEWCIQDPDGSVFKYYPRPLKYVFKFTDEGRKYYKKGKTWYCLQTIAHPKFYECTSEGEPLVEMPMPEPKEFEI